MDILLGGYMSTRGGMATILLPPYFLCSNNFYLIGFNKVKCDVGQII